MPGLQPAGVIALAVALAFAAAQAMPATVARLPDGRALAFRCSGSGAPTVLFESGWAAGAPAWWRVQPLVARRHRACSYDRAGMGASDSGPRPRDAAAIVANLDAGLRAAGIAGPFVVVGHSAGGLYARLFAARRPGDVVGLVLVDPSVEYQDRRLAAVLGPGAGSSAGLRARTAACLAAATAGALPSPDPALARCDASLPAATLATELSELDSLWTATSDEVAAAPIDRALPLVVLTAGATNAALPEPARAAADAAWTRLHDEVAARSTAGVRRTVDGSSHLMPKDRPDAIADAVEAVVAAAAARRP